MQGLLFFRAAGSKSHHIGVSGQLLHDFLGLQVPNVNLMISRSDKEIMTTFGKTKRSMAQKLITVPHLIVLTARYNPLATSDGEVGENAIFLVFVPGVGLQTLALALYYK